MAPQDPADVPTPPPVSRESAVPDPVGVADSGATRSGAAGGRRPTRSHPPRERSGPIGISGGDFSTPVVRKRTTTQPRGLPVVGPLLAAAEAAASVPTPAPQVAMTPAPQVAMAPPPQVAMTPPPQVAPAAPPQVALTPPPEPRAQVATPPPAPPPVEASTSSVAGASMMAATPPPMPVSASAPAAAVDGVPSDAMAATPAPTTPLPPLPSPPPLPGAEGEGPFVAGAIPESDDHAALLAAEAAAVRALDSGPITPPPEVLPEVSAQAVQPGTEIGDPTPPPRPAFSGAADEANRPTPAPEPVAPPPPAPSAPVAEAAGALPTSTMGSEESERSSGDAHAVVSVDAMVDDDAEVAPSDDLEVIPPEALTEAHSSSTPASGATAAASGASPPPLRAVPSSGSQPRTPPPIPVSSLKTPNPELPDLERSGGGASGSFPSIPGLPVLPEALAQRPRRPKRSKPWFEEVFDEDYLRTLPFMSADQTLREVDFVEQSLQLPVGAEVLDVGCGYGRHAIELVHRGLNVTGLDLSLPLLIRAADEAQRRSLAVNFVHADMREMAFEKQFDGAYCMLTSFGYFDEEANLKVAEGIAKALKPGGRFLLDVINRDYVIADLPSRVWWEGKGCVVLEEVDFNYHTSRIVTHRSIVFEDGRQLEQEISIRAYSLHEVGRLLRQAGFRVVDVSGTLATKGQFFGNTSRSLLVLAERRAQDA